MTREEAIAVLEAIRQFIIAHHLFTLAEEDNEAIDMAISALSVIEQTKWERDTALATLEEHGIGLGQRAEPSDLISRTDAIETAKGLVMFWSDPVYRKEKESDVEDSFNDIPSADAVQGEWIRHEDYGGFDYWECSNCEEDFYFEVEPPKRYNYCPSCGARMENTK